jgi:hypothetical protein
VALEFAGVSLGDTRLDSRLGGIVEQLDADPALSIPAAMGTVAKREAFYRFVNNERVTLPAVMQEHIKRTVDRASSSGGLVVVPIDKTSFVFNGEKLRTGLKRLQKHDQGFEAFFAIATSLGRTPHGVVSIVPLEKRGKTGADSWFDAVEKAASQLGSLKAVFVADREADAYELLAKLVAAGHQFVIRVATDRLAQDVSDDGRQPLDELALKTTAVLTRTVTLSQRAWNDTPGSRKRHPPRVEREAALSVRACEVLLKKPRKLEGEFPAEIKLNAVHVREECPPEGTDRVEWMLLTPLPIDTPEAVATVIDAYRARWTIEEYFKALKTGCAFESRQLESRDALLNALGLFAPIAWRLLGLKSAASGDPRPASALLDEDELHVLRKLSVDVKLSDSPTAAEALAAIASVGGHIKQNGPPGWIVLWRGFRKLLDRVEGYRLARAEM